MDNWDICSIAFNRLMCTPSAASNGLCNIYSIVHCLSGKCKKENWICLSIMMIIMMFVSMFWVSGQWSMVNFENDTAYSRVHNLKHQCNAFYVKPFNIMNVNLPYIHSAWTSNIKSIFSDLNLYHLRHIILY